MKPRGRIFGLGSPTLFAIGLTLAGALSCCFQVARAAPMPRSQKEISASVDALISQGKLDSARVILRSALASDSMNVDFWLRLARVEKKRRRASARSDALHRVFHLTPRTLEGRIELIPDLLDRHRTDSALVMAKQTLALTHSIDAVSWYWMGRAYEQSAQFDSASAAFQQAYTLLGRGTF